MMRDEAIVQIYGLKKFCEDMADSDENGSYVFDLDVQALDLALSALRPVSRERVEQMRGEWVGMTDDDGCTWLECSRCEYGLDSLEEPNHFCPACGSPMDDEAVDILYNNLKKLFEQEDS